MVKPSEDQAITQVTRSHYCIDWRKSCREKIVNVCINNLQELRKYMLRRTLSLNICLSTLLVAMLVEHKNKCSYATLS